MIVSFKEDLKGNKFPYIDFGSEVHGRTSFRLWVSGKLLIKENDEYVVRFPVKNATIVKTEKGSLVLKPGSGIVYDVYVPCGYRGRGDFEILKSEGYEVIRYYVYKSQRGSLGISKGGLVVFETIEPLVYKWTRSGRLYGDPPSGITMVSPDGDRKEIDEIPDGLEALEELPTLGKKE